MSVVHSLRGQLLVSGPSLVDPNFRHTVVLLGEHGEEGAMGIVLNRRSEVAVGDAVPPLAALVGRNELVYLGGPVQPEAVVVLADFAEPGRAGRTRARRASASSPASSTRPQRSATFMPCGSSPATPAGGAVSSRPSSRRDPGSSSRPWLGRLHRATGRPLARGPPPRGRKIRTSRPRFPADPRVN